MEEKTVKTEVILSSKSTLAERFMLCQRDVASVIKKNKTQYSNVSYTYASESDVLEAVKTVFSKYNLYYQITSYNVLPQSSDSHLFVEVLIEIGCPQTEEYKTITDIWGISLKRGMDFAQSLGALKTYGIRYFLCKLLGIANDEVDVDRLAPKLAENEMKAKTKKALIDEIKTFSVSRLEKVKAYLQTKNVSVLSHLSQKDLQHIIKDIK